MNFPLAIGQKSGVHSASYRRRALLIGLALVVMAAIAGYALHASRLEAQRQVATGLAEARARAVSRAQAAAKAKAQAAALAAASVPVSRVAPSTQADELFAPHSWYVAPPPPPAAAEEAPAAPTAPPLPYTYVGSYSPGGERPTYFLARGDRVIDAHVGDKLDGVLLFEKVDGGQIVFNYLPLNIRQTLPAGVVQ